MRKEDLDRAFNRCFVITFENYGELNTFLMEIKSFGGTWINGKEIHYDKKNLDSQEKITCRLTVDRNYTIANLMGICYHYGAYPTIKYAKFKTDIGTIDENNHIKSDT